MAAVFSGHDGGCGWRIPAVGASTEGAQRRYSKYCGVRIASCYDFNYFNTIILEDTQYMSPTDTTSITQEKGLKMILKYFNEYLVRRALPVDSTSTELIELYLTGWCTALAPYDGENK